MIINLPRLAYRYNTIPTCYRIIRLLFRRDDSNKRNKIKTNARPTTRFRLSPAVGWRGRRARGFGKRTIFRSDSARRAPCINARAPRRRWAPAELESAVAARPRCAAAHHCHNDFITNPARARLPPAGSSAAAVETGAVVVRRKRCFYHLYPFAFAPCPLPTPTGHHSPISLSLPPLVLHTRARARAYSV